MRQRILEHGPELRRRVLLAVVVLTPLLFVRSAYDPINVPKLSLLMVGTALAAGIRGVELLQGASSEGLRRLLLPVTALGLPLVLAWSVSPYPGWALFGAYGRFGGLLPYLVVFLFGIMVADAFAGRVTDLAWALLVAGGAAGVYALVQVAGLDPFEWSIEDAVDRGAYSTLGNPNFAGAFFGMVLPVGIGLCVVDPNRRRLAVGLLTLTVGGWLSSLSEAGWAAGVAGAALAGGMLLGRGRPRWRMAGALIATAILAAALAVVPFAVINPDSPVVPQTIDRRADWWETAASMAMASPLVGRGPNSFAIEGVQHRTLQDALKVGYFSTNDPHSVYMSFLTSAGVIGLIGYLVAVGWAIRTGYTERLGGPMAAAFSGLLVAYLVQSFVSIDTVALRVVAWTGLGALAASTASAAVPSSRKSGKKRRPVPAPVRAAPAVVCVVIATVGAMWLSTRVFLADLDFSHAKKLMDEGDVEGASARFDSAVQRRSDAKYLAEVGREMGGVAVSLGSAGRPDLGERYLERARAAFAFTEDLPQVDAIVSHARVLQGWSRFEPATRAEALALFQRAIRLDPLNPSLVAEAAHAALLFEMYEEAVSIASSPAEKLDVAALWGVLARAHAHAGNHEEARLAIERALTLDPAEAHALLAQELLEARG